MDVEQASQAWVDEFKKLPEKRQEAIKRWYGVQAYMAKELGIELEEWMEHVQWAFANPFDYSFVADFPEVAAAFLSGDGFEKAQSSAALLGKQEAVPASPTDKPSGNSLFDFMLGRSSGADAKEEPPTK